MELQARSFGGGMTGMSGRGRDRLGPEDAWTRPRRRVIVADRAEGVRRHTPGAACAGTSDVVMMIGVTSGDIEGIDSERGIAWRAMDSTAAMRSIVRRDTGASLAMRRF